MSSSGASLEEETTDLSSEPEPEVSSEEDFVDSEERKLAQKRARSQDGDTSSESEDDSVGNTYDGGSDDDYADEFSDEEDW